MNDRPGMTGTRAAIRAAGLDWSVAAWGDPAGRPVLLLHGVVSSSDVWWRVGPALAATGRRVFAPDLPGHGRTGTWTGHHAHRAAAADVADLARALGVARVTLQVVGHSWGAMIAAALPAAGLVPATLVLLDPPALRREQMAAMVDDPTEQRYDDIDAALAVVRAANPGWSSGDIEAKALSLTTFDEAAARAVLLDNGDWDAGLADLAHPAARGVPTWLIRGEPAAGGMIPDTWLGRLVERLGATRVITIPGAPHSPQRTHFEATILALIGALDAASETSQAGEPDLAGATRGLDEASRTD